MKGPRVAAGLRFAVRDRPPRVHPGMSMRNAWDELSEHFDTNRADPDPGVVANMERTWALLLPWLPAAGSLLDFGCGTGALCRRLHRRGLDVWGLDPSGAMLGVARRHSPRAIHYVSDLGELPRGAVFELITASMVLQFVPDVPAVLAPLLERLRPGGTLWFSVHHPAYIFEPAAQTRFQDRDVATGRATMTLPGRTADQAISLYVRSGATYADELGRLGYQPRGEWTSSPDEGRPPKYLVMAFRRVAR